MLHLIYNSHKYLYYIDITIHSLLHTTSYFFYSFGQAGWPRSLRLLLQKARINLALLTVNINMFNARHKLT